MRLIVVCIDVSRDSRSRVRCFLSAVVSSFFLEIDPPTPPSIARVGSVLRPFVVVRNFPLRVLVHTGVSLELRT